MTAQQPAPLVGVVMGSSSDWDVMQHAVVLLKEFGIPHEAQVVSAHRMPDDMFRYAEAARGRGLRAIIAGAGVWKARHFVTGDVADVDVTVLAAGVIAAAISGWIAIGFLLRYLRTHSTGIFIAYRLVAAAVFFVLILMTP